MALADNINGSRYRVVVLLLATTLSSTAANASPRHHHHSLPMPADEVDAYRALAEAQARNYDRTQDISPHQLLILLEVSERTGASLGQLLATGEFESAKTWNDFVRPTLGNGKLGSATGVWQFIPSTFHRIMRRFGDELLAASSADAGTGRAPLDLSAGPFTDAQVRGIIAETVAGVRDADDEELQLLRHNFAVLAFAKHYLSIETGAATPEEDYLFHFLGERRGREILELARGHARHTLSVGPPESGEGSPVQPGARPVTNVDGRVALRVRSILHPRPAPYDTTLRAGREMIVALGDPIPKPLVGAEIEPDLLGKIDARVNDLAARTASRSDGWSTREVDIPERRSSAWGLPADSPIVTGNPGMFYRDGHGKREPYTWAEFMSALSERVKAQQQPVMVRAKYGVGFDLDGGDMPGWSRNDGAGSEMLELNHEPGADAVIPKRLLTAPLTADERRAYKRRLATLIDDGEARPTSAFSPPIVLALKHLGLMTLDETDFDTYEQRLLEALRAFRTLVGKAEPDDPTQTDKVLPSERVALELYDHRVARYTALQRAQQAAMRQALDLNAIGGLLKSHRRASRPHIAELQRALANEGLETQVHGGRKTTAHFDGIAGKLTVGSLNRFQLRSGVRQTDGRLDPITAALLGVPPLGYEIFLPPSGPFCLIPDAPAALAYSENPDTSKWTTVIRLVREGQAWAAGSGRSTIETGIWTTLLSRNAESIETSASADTEVM